VRRTWSSPRPFSAAALPAAPGGGPTGNALRIFRSPGQRRHYLTFCNNFPQAAPWQHDQTPLHHPPAPRPDLHTHADRVGTLRSDLSFQERYTNIVEVLYVAYHLLGGQIAEMLFVGCTYTTIAQYTEQYLIIFRKSSIYIFHEMPAADRSVCALLQSYELTDLLQRLEGR
jgi:hypothetical protein